MGIHRGCSKIGHLLKVCQAKPFSDSLIPHRAHGLVWQKMNSKMRKSLQNHMVEIDGQENCSSQNQGMVWAERDIKDLLQLVIFNNPTVNLIKYFMEVTPIWFWKSFLHHPCPAGVQQHLCSLPALLCPLNNRYLLFPFIKLNLKFFHFITQT